MKISPDNKLLWYPEEKDVVRSKDQCVFGSTCFVLFKLGKHDTDMKVKVAQEA